MARSTAAMERLAEPSALSAVDAVVVVVDTPEV
jgi:hypothetical protein